MRSGSRAGYEGGAASAVNPPRLKASPRSPVSGGTERIAALSALVEELSGQIDAIEGASRRDAIRRSVRQAAAQPDRQEPARPADREGERLSAIESRLAAIAEEITRRDRPAEPPVDARRQEIGSLQAAIEEISERQRTIDRSGGRQLPTIDTIALEDALRALRDEIGALDRRIATEARRGEELGRAIHSGLAERLQPAGSDSMIAALRDDLAEIRRAVDLAARETTLASIESGYGHVIERLDDIVRRVPERDRLDGIAKEIARLAERIDQAPRPRDMDGELEDIRNAIASIGARGSDDRLLREIGALREVVGRFGAPELSRIEERLDALAGRFDGSSDRRIADLGMAIEKLAARPLPMVDLTRIERDIGLLRREIDGLAKSTDPVALLRLEQQIAAIRTALDERAQPAAEAAAFQRLEERLDALAGRLDAIAELPSLAAPASDDAIAGLRAEIAALHGDVAQRQPARFDEIEDQMRGLIRRLDEAADRDDGQALAQLEAQVGALAEKLATVEPGVDALSKVEANLDRLQGLLAEARHDTIEAARTTARTTVEEFAGSLAGGRDDAMVAALREDLRRLQDAAMHSGRQNEDTLEAVHDTLAKVVDRIAQLEAQGADTQLSVSLKERVRSVVPPRHFAADDLPEDHRPLAPGSGKPDLAAAAPRAEVETGGDRKADFIAAARRAAQAAQAETAKARAEMREGAPSEERPGPFARIGQALRGRRRTLVLAIAAVVLAIGAAKIGPSMQDRIVEALTPAVARTSGEALDRTATGSIPAKAVRNATANPAPAPALVAPKPNSEALAFSPDPFTDFGPTAAAAKPAATEAATAAPSPSLVLDYALVESAANRGDAVAAFEMAKRYAEPAMGRADIKTAAAWYERAAKAGLAVAQYRLGSLYERGEGVKLDVAAAQGWYEKASLQGNARATHNLAVLISEGANGKADYKHAADLFIVAATMGVADSQYNLGVLYARGLGVPVDLVQSYKWFALAAQQGDTDAGGRRDEVAKAMKADDLAAARLAVQAFKATPLNPVANNEPTPDPAWFAAPAATSMQEQTTPLGRLAGSTS
ncbi:localization factor PodJL [Kaistia hirudinis]|uniref:Localization factor PodJL n=1 Tax=Kaistia hirudinis TaxID=1293440 RepID=A0A840AUV9_9HYPH|nr:SEL1-like repeat protein [Kaistia hirudinis]MBB3933472.1 localization factor PodJL [Kaistia hirudinis]